ncbi:11470_t:CDS:2 [Funneliformis caledonium]|uniref:Phosphatidylglycerol/phosphatidylinositol transfer protein n=1 Tax=Funneliformis caledonium TaxID=1117310 RepID=A0A9N9D765_9GLOM|nr:11470_t:CDS:2 [Funneliformis caledonium]
MGYFKQNIATVGYDREKKVNFRRIIARHMLASSIICTTSSTTPPPLLQVSLSPDPPVAGQKDTVTVSGKFSKDVTNDTILAVVFAQPGEGIIGDPVIVPACTGSGCPIKAGEQYTQTVEIQAPADLPNPYLLGAAVGNPVTHDALGCAIATI